jgi:hypothetical protein
MTYVRPEVHNPLSKVRPPLQQRSHCYYASDCEIAPAPAHAPSSDPASAASAASAKAGAGAGNTAPFQPITSAVTEILEFLTPQQANIEEILNTSTSESPFQTQRPYTKGAI